MQEREASIEAREADEWYQKSLDWDRSCRRSVEDYATELRVSRELPDSESEHAALCYFDVYLTHSPS